MHEADNDRNRSAGALETSPLVVGIVGISIPVSLLALAAVTGSVVALVFAVLGMLVVGAATLAFMFRLTADPPELEGRAVAGE
ncbi:MAG: hypothetical protein ABSB69_00955 [Solirubrobacteraceae bacterium]|jgi:hypothetical protein